MSVEKQTIEPSTNIIQVIERAAVNPEVDVLKMEKLLDMQERILTKQAEMSFNQAMAAMQPHMPIIKRRKRGHNSNYATYEHVDEMVRPLYTEHGFSVSFNSKREGETVTYYATLCHVDGHSRTAEIDLPADTSGNKNAIQAKASTITYAKRYLLTMLLNIVTAEEDDDGYIGGSQLISESEAKVLEDMAKRVGADVPKFLKFMGVESFEVIAQKDFKKAENALKAKEKK